MKKFFQSIIWIKSYPVIFWSLKIVLTILIGVVAFLVAKATLKDLPVSFLIGLVFIYAYMGYQITHHSQMKTKELFIFARMCLILIFFSMLACVMGFIFLNKAVGWAAIIILAYSIIFLVIRMLKEAKLEN